MPLPLVPLVWTTVISLVTAAFSRLFASRIGQWCVAALVFLGLEFVTTTFAIEPLINTVQANFSAIPPEVLNLMSLINLDRYLTILFSAYATAFAMSAGRAYLSKKPAIP